MTFGPALLAAVLAAAPQAPDRRPHLSADVVDQVRRCATRLADQDRFSGVLLVKQNGSPLLEFSSAAAGSGPFTMDTPFNIASAAKMFTAVAIGQLAEQGRLRFGDRLGKFLPELPPALAAVRIDQALTHTGGIQGMTRLTPELASAIRNARSARDLVPLVAAAGLAFPPGSRTEYSNGGFVLLGAVVEAASGQPFRDYVRQNILRRAGMSATGPDEPPNAAARFSRMAPGAQPGGRARTRMSGGATPAGGWYSSARDLARFAAALHSGRLLKPSTLATMTAIRSGAGSANAPAAGERRGYGYGFSVAEARGDRIVGHNGGAPGANAEAAFSTTQGWTIVALSNIDPPAATNLMNFARAVVVGRATIADCDRFGSAPGPFDRPQR